HHGELWTNIGNNAFHSELLPTLSRRNVLMKKEGNLDHMMYIVSCRKTDKNPSCPYSLNHMQSQESGATKIIWGSMTCPRYYLLSRRFSCCQGKESDAVPLLETMCHIKILQNTRDFSVEKLPLPQIMLKKMDELRYIMTHEDGASGKRIISKWQMNACRVHSVLKKEDELGRNSCPIQ
ncbi:MAG: hypothetical protein MJE68_25635, partial [Proteobacteria bacterium]|nr:hypothetical protein [Pseudomonadota bacterium]